MADIKSKEARSYNMSRVRSKDTGPEVYLRKKLFAKGYRYRKYTSDLPGHPDLWLAKYHAVIFIHGCFWHRHQGCRMATTPSSNTEYWDAKFIRNMRRDQEVKNQLSMKHIRQLVIWECTVRKMMKSSEQESLNLEKIDDFLKSKTLYAEI